LVEVERWGAEVLVEVEWWGAEVRGCVELGAQRFEIWVALVGKLVAFVGGLDVQTGSLVALAAGLVAIAAGLVALAGSFVVLSGFLVALAEGLVALAGGLVALAGGLVELAGGPVALDGGPVALPVSLVGLAGGFVAEVSVPSIGEGASETEEECVAGTTEDVEESVLEHVPDEVEKPKELEGKWKGLEELVIAELEAEKARQPGGNVETFVEEDGWKSGAVKVG
jgi:hypothetical protein